MSRKTKEAVEELAYGIGGLIIGLSALWWIVNTWHAEIARLF